MYHRHSENEKSSCSVATLKTRRSTGQKVYFDHKSRRWVYFFMISWFVLVVLGVLRVMIKKKATSVDFSNSSPTNFLGATTISITSLQERTYEAANLMNSFDYDTPPVENSGTLINPKTPTSPLVVLILSKRDHFQRRSVIRQTWGKAYVAGLYFVIGGDALAVHGASDEVQQLLQEEQARNRDLLDTIHPESYRGLPHKLRYAIRWVMLSQPEHDPTVQWILKVDDDMYVRSLSNFVRREHSSVGSSALNSSVPIVLGQIQYQIPVQRHGKWAEDFSYYRHHPIYPPWPKGSCGYLMSRSAASLLAQKYTQDLSSRLWGLHEEISLRSYQGEDTSLGIWLEGSSISWISSPHFVNDGQCLSKGDLPFAWSIGHRISPELMQKCFEEERQLVQYNSIPSSIYETTILDTPTSIDEGFKSNGKVESEAFRSAMLHSELDRKSIRNEMALDQRRQRREAKRHEQQLLRLSSDQI